MTVDQTSAGRDLLAKIPLLSGADPSTIAELVQRLERVHVEAGEVVVRQGDAGDRLFLVASGRLRVFVEDDDGPRVLRELGSGAALGELALLTGEPRSASVVAVRDSELLELTADAFESLLERDAGFATAIARALALQLQASGGLLPPATRPAVLCVRSLGFVSDDAIGAPRSWVMGVRRRRWSNSLASWDWTTSCALRVSWRETRW